MKLLEPQNTIVVFSVLFALSFMCSVSSVGKYRSAINTRVSDKVVRDMVFDITACIMSFLWVLFTVILGLDNMSGREFVYSVFDCIDLVFILLCCTLYLSMHKKWKNKPQRICCSVMFVLLGAMNYAYTIFRLYLRFKGL